MPLTFGSVATLAAQFDRPVARIDPSDATATLGRINKRKVNPSAVANAARDASIRQAPARLRLLLCPAPHVISSEHGRATSPATSRLTSESTFLPQQGKVAERRAFFERLALESKPQPPASLDRADIPKRLGAGLPPDAVIWEPTTCGDVPCVDGESSRDEVIDRPQAMEPAKSTKRPGLVALRLGNIVQNRKACLRTRETSLVHASEDITVPTKFFLPSPVSPGSVAASSGNDSGHSSPIDEILRGPSSRDDKVSVGVLALPPPSARVAALQSRFDSLYITPPKRTLSPTSSEDSQDSGHSTYLPDLQVPASANKQGELERYFSNLVPPASSKEGPYLDDDPSLEEVLSDYESDSCQSSSEFSGLSSPSSPPGSPDTHEPKSSWSQAYAEALSQPPFTPPDEGATWTEVKDAIGQLNAAIADEDEYVVSEDAIDLLQLAGSHVANHDIQAAHDALMRALGGVTRIQAVQGETTLRSLSPTLSEPASLPWEGEPADNEWVEALEDLLAGLDLLAGPSFHAHKERLETLDDLLEGLGLITSRDMPADYAKSAQGRGAKTLLTEARKMLERSPVRTVYSFLEPAMRDLGHLPSTTPLRKHGEVRVHEPRPLFAEGFWT